MEPKGSPKGAKKEPDTSQDDQKPLASSLWPLASGLASAGRAQRKQFIQVNSWQFYPRCLSVVCLSLFSLNDFGFQIWAILLTILGQILIFVGPLKGAPREPLGAPKGLLRGSLGPLGALGEG